MLLKQFRESHPSFHIEQRDFESLKPFYCVSLKIWNTCCCKYHVEFSMHHELLCSISCTLHSIEMLENCGASGLPKSWRDLLDQFLCHRLDDYFFYINDFLNEKCSECGGLSKFDTCFHEGCEQDLRKTIVLKKKGVYEIVKYTLKSGGESSRCELVEKILVWLVLFQISRQIFFTSMQDIVTSLSSWINNLEFVRRFFPLTLIY